MSLRVYFFETWFLNFVRICRTPLATGFPTYLRKAALGIWRFALKLIHDRFTKWEYRSTISRQIINGGPGSGEGLPALVFSPFLA